MDACTDRHLWNRVITTLPNPHILETWEWGEFKSEYGWEPFRFIWRDAQNQVVAACQVLRKRILTRGFAARLCILYAPRGPLLDWDNLQLKRQVLNDLQAYATDQQAIFIKIDPEVILGIGIPGDEDAMDGQMGAQAVHELQSRSWRFSRDQIQFRNTVWIDLTGDKDLWLSRMKQKTRYTIRLAERKGVIVRHADASDFSEMYSMYRETAVRDGFVIRPESYYTGIWRRFLQAGMMTPLMAEVEGKPVAAVILFHFGNRAWYLYGMSRAEAREWMPNYLLQWEAMKTASAQGCACYDLWGAPDVFDETDSMWGVFRFKQGLGGKVIRTIGAYDYTPMPLLYRMYTNVIPKVLDVMRRRGKKQNQREMS